MGQEAYMSEFAKRPALSFQEEIRAVEDRRNSLACAARVPWPNFGKAAAMQAHAAKNKR